MRYMPRYIELVHSDTSFDDLTNCYSVYSSVKVWFYFNPPFFPASYILTQSRSTVLSILRKGWRDMAEGLNLASPAVEGEIPKESAEVTERVSTQSVERVEEEKEQAKESAQPRADVMPEKEEPKSVKMKLVLKDDDPRAEGHKSKCTSKRCLGCEKKKGASEASEMVEISSEEDDTPHDKKESEATYDGQMERGSPTKPGENPQLAATKSGAPKDAEHPSPNPTDREEMGSPTKPGENRVIPSLQPVQKVDVENQQATPTSHEEPSVSKREVSESEDDEERYQLERKRKGKAQPKRRRAARN